MSIILYMVRIQENPTTKALLVQIPKAIAEAKGLEKGMDVKFKMDDSGRLYLETPRNGHETNNA